MMRHPKIPRAPGENFVASASKGAAAGDRPGAIKLWVLVALWALCALLWGVLFFGSGTANAAAPGKRAAARAVEPKPVTVAPNPGAEPRYARGRPAADVQQAFRDGAASELVEITDVEQNALFARWAARSQDREDDWVVLRRQKDAGDRRTFQVRIGNDQPAGYVAMQRRDGAWRITAAATRLEDL